MNILFVHNNFPAQFRHLAQVLAADSANTVAAIGSNTAMSLPGVRLTKYSLPQPDVRDTHPFARRFDVECRRAEQVLYGLSTLAHAGFQPDLIFAHPGWGETMPLRNMFPKAKIALYCEYYYNPRGGDLGFDPEFPATGLDGHIGLSVKNAATLLALQECDIAISPTHWQRSTFPRNHQARIEVAHEGIKVEVARPDREAVLQLPEGQLGFSDEVITYVARNLEPVRGYHILMRVISQVLAQRPKAHVVIVGGEGTSYGANPPQGTTWKSIFLDEVKQTLDLSRVHFLGSVPYNVYLRVLQISSVHLYWTYPFVLSWSMLEAMSCGCVVVGSDTPPVREVIDGNNGMLVPFFDVAQWTERIVDILSGPQTFEPMRDAARAFIQQNYDADTVCVPRLLRLLQFNPQIKLVQDPGTARGFKRLRPGRTRGRGSKPATSA